MLAENDAIIYGDLKVEESETFEHSSQPEKAKAAASFKVANSIQPNESIGHVELDKAISFFDMNETPVAVVTPEKTAPIEASTGHLWINYSKLKKKRTQQSSHAI